MFEGLKWKSAARRAAIVMLIYLGLLYILSRAFPDRFQIEVVAFLPQVVFFFLVFTLVYALIERSRDRRMAQASKQGKSGKPSQDGGDTEDDASSLKGRPNPNTSRKKTRRRR